MESQIKIGSFRLFMIITNELAQYSTNHLK